MRSSFHKKEPERKEPARRRTRKPLTRVAGKSAPRTVEEYICDVNCVHPDLVDKLEGTALDWNRASELSEIFRVMSDPNRLRIISLLAQSELCVCDIAASLNMTQSAVSHQLRVLRITELVKVRKEGRVAWYSLDDEHVLKLFTQGLDHVGHTVTDVD